MRLSDTFILMLTTILVHFMIQTSQGQEKPNHLAFASYDASNGLSNSHINAIEQDYKGFIWVGTNDGLNRFNGLSFQTFHYSLSDSNSISSNTIFCILNDKDNRIWFGTFAGLCRYDNVHENFVRVALPSLQGKGNVPVRGMAQSPNGDIWIATSGNGLVRINAESAPIAHYTHQPGKQNSICSNYLQTVAVDNSNRVWIGSENNGITIYDPQKETYTNITKESGKIGGNVISYIYKDKSGKIWIGAYEGNVSVYSPETDSFQIIKLSQHSDLSVFGITSGNYNDVWIGTQEEGLFHYDSNRIDHFSNQLGNTRGLISDNIHALFTDQQHNLWLGIFQGGINRLKPRPLFEGFEGGKDSELQNMKVLGIYPDSKSRVYVCTDGDGLIIWDTGQKQVRQIKAGQKGLRSNSIRCAYKDHENRIWLGTYLRGLQEYRPGKDVFSSYENIPGNPQSLSNNDVTCIVEDRLGNLWIGTNGGLNLLDKATGTFRRYMHSDDNPSKTIINNHITSLYIDHHGYLWICTYFGLSRMDPAKGDVTNFPMMENENTYYCIYEDSKQRLWAGTTLGLKLLDPNSGNFTLYTTEHGLPSNMVDGIVEDSRGNLWLSTNQGICKFNCDKGTFRNFYTEDGLYSNEFMHNSYASDTDGEIYFGSVNGVTRFYPEELTLSNSTPRIAITELQVFNRKVVPGSEQGILENSIMETSAISLDWDCRSFTLIYNAIDYTQPQKITYASRMTGFDTQWNYHNYSQNSASYTNLNAGVYYFEVKASSDGENWSQPVVLRINIIAPIWKRWWAIISYVAIGLLILLIIYRTYRKNHIEKRANEIRYIKQQNDIELNKSRLQFFTNISHEFRTPLTLIMSPLQQMLSDSQYNSDTKKQFALMHRNAERLLRMVNQIMDIRKIDNSKVQFAPTRSDLVAFIREVYENFNQLASSHQITFRFKTEVPEFMAYFDKELIDKAMYNLLSNAFKFTPAGGKIELSIRHAHRNSPNNIVIIVEDNGKGIREENIDKIFDRFFQGDTSQMQQGTGIGLWLTKEFVDMHHGIISVSSQEGVGTAFTIMLTDGEEFSNMETSNADTYSHISLGAVIEEDTEAETEQPADTAEDAATATTPPQPGIRCSLLIVDDNQEIKDYLASSLGKTYDVKTAMDGNEGLKIAKETLPDLVITDIMMPGLNGIELCKILKSDIETCHIPVIMLTAKSSEEQRIEGLETGADSYIPKPFNPKHLMVRIQKLLELRKTLREKFGNDISFETEQAGITIPDRDLLKKVTSVIKKRISDSKLSVETLAEEVGISRGHLQRKLKSLTGQNPNEFIRIIRLKQAAEILLENDVTIAEVADMVGFNSQSYFSTAFTKQFNISPSQYVESHRINN
ncbi:MAG: response regulator [Bacteroidales bacterium]|nr:response regulator [Bacteroidales bacterium]